MHLIRGLRCSAVIALFCVPAGANAASLQFLADYNLAAGTKFQDTDVGGLSGMAYDPVRNELLVISDDRGSHQSARFYTFHLDLEPGHLNLNPVAVTTLLQPDNSPFPTGSVDPEGLTILNDDRIFVSSEGVGGDQGPRIMPAIFELSRNGHISASLPIPDKFLPGVAGPQTKGVIDNCAFESLTMSQDKKFLFTVAECPLFQDDTPADFHKGGKTRILRFRLDGEDRIPDGEYVYNIEPNAKPEGATDDDDYGNSVADMLALSDHELIVLERGGASVNDKFVAHVRLFKVTIENLTTDVTALQSLQTGVAVSSKKELLLDLDTVLPQLSSGWQSLDNIEGITFGPTLANGHSSLLLISDDNFSEAQRTQVLAFEVLE